LRIWGNEGVVFVRKTEREGRKTMKLKSEEMGNEGERKLRRSKVRERFGDLTVDIRLNSNYETV